MHLLNQILRSQEVGLAGRRGSAADINTTGGPAGDQHHGATGRPYRKGVMADLDAGDRSQASCRLVGRPLSARGQRFSSHATGQG